MDNIDVTKLLDLTERSVDAWAKFQNRLEDLLKSTEWQASELKELNKLLTTKPCITETIPYATLEANIKQEWEKRIKEHADIVTAIKALTESNSKVTETNTKRIEQAKDLTFWLKILIAVLTIGGLLLGIFVV